MTLITLLQKGCKITFPSGCWMKGDPATSYIDVGSPFGGTGCWPLNKAGVDCTLRDITQLEKEMLCE